MYKLKFRDEVDDDLSKLDKSIKEQVFKKLKKISENPEV
jgi:mRNA-degrading endonuclease RelE of RelBE toxin-antitoxin system